MCTISKLPFLSVVVLTISSLPLSAARLTKEIAVPEQLSQNQVSFGTSNSFRGIGFCADIGTYNFHSVSDTADLTNIINGQVSTPGMRMTYHYNGHFIAYVGMEMGRRFETDVTSGYIGVVQGRRVVPLTLRETFYFNGCRKDGFKLFADGELCFTGTFRHQQNWIAKAGVGYRMILGEKPASISLCPHMWQMTTLSQSIYLSTVTLFHFRISGKVTDGV